MKKTILLTFSLLTTLSQAIAHGDPSASEPSDSYTQLCAMAEAWMKSQAENKEPTSLHSDLLPGPYKTVETFKPAKFKFGKSIPKKKRTEIKKVFKTATGTTELNRFIDFLNKLPPLKDGNKYNSNFKDRGDHVWIHLYYGPESSVDFSS